MRVLGLTLILVGLCCGVLAEASEARLGLHRVGHFNSPTYITGTEADPKREFVVERAGRIRVIVQGDVKHHPFLDITSRVSTRSEDGLHSVAFAPDYDETGKFYVYYVGTDHDIHIDQFRTRRPNRARRSSRQKFIEVKSPPDTHKGGQVQMTAKGYLLAATGDGGDFNHPARAAQDKRSQRGKLLRIMPAAQRPAKKRQWRPHPDNPYVGKRGDDAILARGLRNPWRFSLDRKHPERIAIGDVGHSRTEEVDGGPMRKVSGANFGWPCWEGTKKLLGCRVRHRTKPLLTYSHGGGRCSIIGGYVNRAPDLPRQGKYFFGDYCSGEIWTGSLRTGGRDKTPLKVPSLVSFGQDARGNLYTVSLEGDVKRIVRR
jgi:hypothetical protein